MQNTFVLVDQRWQKLANLRQCVLGYFSDICLSLGAGCRVRQFIRELPPGAVIADVGCGNGKYFGVRQDVAVLGSDRRPGLAQVQSDPLPPLKFLIDKLLVTVRLPALTPCLPQSTFVACTAAYPGTC